MLKGGEDGPVLVAHFSEKSEIIRRVKLPAGHDDAMPTKGKRLTDDEITLLEFWIKQGAPWPVGPEKSLYRVATLEPRYARLAGLAGTQAQLDAALAERRGLVERHAYSASFDAGRAGSDAQQRARDLFAKAGLEVASTQVLPAKTVDGYERIPIVLRVEGDFSALHSALVVLHSQAPTLFIDGFQSQSVMPVRADAPVRVSVQLNLFVLRART